MTAAAFLMTLYLSSLVVSGLTTPLSLGPEAKVVTKPAPPKGLGVFAVAAIPKGTSVCRYEGQLLTVQEELELYPYRYPDYCLQISPDRSIDGAHSDHWSRLINHHQNANLNLHTHPEAGTAHFTAARDIDPGEELCFDYGVAYFLFRNIVPALGTESRSFQLPTETDAEARAQAPPDTPRSPEELQKWMNSPEEDVDSKKSSFLRVLDFYSALVWMEDGDTVDIPVDLRGKRERISYGKVSLEYLHERLVGLWNESQTTV